MINKRIELSASYIEIHINEINKCPTEILELEEIKFIVHLNNQHNFEENYKYLLDLPKNKHIQIHANKHALGKINIEEIKNNFIIKSIEIKEYHYFINCFSVEEVNSPILINNQKIIDKMDILSDRIISLSKAHELAYTATKILDEYKETDSNFKVIKQKLNYVNTLASKM